VKRLYRDAAERRFVALVRLAGGGWYPGHWHSDAEELYVLEGSLQIEGQALQAGDFYAAPAGNVHDITSGEGGCLCLLLSPEVDEPMERAEPEAQRAKV